MEKNNLLRLVLGGLFAALACVATMIIQVPSFGPSGYVNLGDCIVLLSGWILGGGMGALAAGIGSGMADVLTGYAFYAPGTLVIKLIMAVIAAYGWKALKKLGVSSKPAMILSGLAAEIWMILGYLLYEAFVLKYGAAALAAVASNGIQGTMNLLIAPVLMLALEAAHALKYVPGRQ